MGSWLIKKVFLVLSFCFLCVQSKASNVLPFELPVNPAKLPHSASVDTTKGLFKIKFYPDKAPLHVRNFEYLVSKGFYTGIDFHLYQEGYIIQTGDPKGNGKGGPGYNLPPEFSDVKHYEGTISMARAMGESNPERLSSGSQFFICLRRANHLDGMFTTFAEVISGMDNVRRLRIGDKILSMELGYE
ncbi:MAG: peptidylprolyl isomerase [Deltaproteobacteria bacterium]|nr:peptidylprolyl isomerase [Deltaproteobacteria bacterium]